MDILEQIGRDPSIVANEMFQAYLDYFPDISEEENKKNYIRGFENQMAKFDDGGEVMEFLLEVLEELKK